MMAREHHVVETFLQKETKIQLLNKAFGDANAKSPNAGVGLRIMFHA